jgi:hypothetical protein
LPHSLLKVSLSIKLEQQQQHTHKSDAVRFKSVVASTDVVDDCDLTTARQNDNFAVFVCESVRKVGNASSASSLPLIAWCFRRLGVGLRLKTTKSVMVRTVFVYPEFCSVISFSNVCDARRSSAAALILIHYCPYAPASFLFVSHQPTNHYCV